MSLIAVVILCLAAVQGLEPLSARADFAAARASRPSTVSGSPCSSPRSAKHRGRRRKGAGPAAPTLAATTTVSENPNGKTLKEAYLAALAVSEVVGEQREMWAQMNELEKQATSALLPTVNANMTFERQAVPNSGIGSFVFPGSENTIQIHADQPLFRGLREFAALRQRRDLSSSQAFSVANAARQLFYDTATAYYNVLAYAADARNYRREIEQDNLRLRDLENFYRIGRAQLTDVLTQKSAIASLQIALQNANQQLETAKDILAFECGWNRDTPLRDTENPLPGDGNVDTYLARLEQRADVQLAIQNVKAYEEGVPIARGQYLPSVDLMGDYYLTRPGALDNVNWDAELAITFPIFTAGAIASQVRQAESVARQYDLMLSQARRTAEEEIRTFYDALTGDRNQLNELLAAVDLARQNYGTEIQYYRNGLVTNLDVLTAITTYQATQLQLDHQRMTVSMDSAKLQAATGQRPEIAINLENGKQAPPARASSNPDARPETRKD